MMAQGLSAWSGSAWPGLSFGHGIGHNAQLSSIAPLDNAESALSKRRKTP